MLQNIKLDIIYYLVPKDFELEFNLCGCCRMRLLTTQVNDLKEFIGSLELCVARSRIILLSGKLDGNDGLFSIISKAISRETESIENSLYGIAAPGKTELMKNAIPLITKSGVLAGCVVEQGPQAIIIVTGDRNDRREIMNELVHPYISDLSNTAAIPDRHNDTAAVPDITDASEEQPEDINIPMTDTADMVVPEPLPQSNDTPEPDSQTQYTESAVTDISVDAELPEVNTEPAADNKVAAIPDSVDITGRIPQAPVSDKIFPESGINSFVEDDADSDDYLFDDSIFSTEHFSLIDSYAEEKQTARRRKPSHSGAPVILILVCILLCLLGILGYFLIFRPLYNGIPVNDYIHNLIPFLTRRL